MCYTQTIWIRLIIFWYTFEDCTLHCCQAKVALFKVGGIGIVSTYSQILLRLIDTSKQDRFTPFTLLKHDHLYGLRSVCLPLPGIELGTIHWEMRKSWRSNLLCYGAAIISSLVLFYLKICFKLGTMKLEQKQLSSLKIELLFWWICRQVVYKLSSRIGLATGLEILRPFSSEIYQVPIQ